MLSHRCEEGRRRRARILTRSRSGVTSKRQDGRSTRRRARGTDGVRLRRRRPGQRPTTTAPPVASRQDGMGCNCTPRSRLPGRAAVVTQLRLEGGAFRRGRLAKRPRHHPDGPYRPMRPDPRTLRRAMIDALRSGHLGAAGPRRLRERVGRAAGGSAICRAPSAYRTSDRRRRPPEMRRRAWVPRT
jgi:hypothetical protein